MEMRGPLVKNLELMWHKPALTFRSRLEQQHMSVHFGASFHLAKSSELVVIYDTKVAISKT